MFENLPRFLINPSTSDKVSSYSDCIIIGSGIAGLSTAIRISNLAKVKIFTKSSLKESNTWYAQGGIAAAIKGPDNWEHHYGDTIKSGQGLCDGLAVETLVKNAPAMIKDLIENGIQFDIANGEIGLTLEGGHSSPRILHAGGDATGEEIEKKLIDYSRKLKNIEFFPESFALDILVEDNKCVGVMVLDILSGKVEIHPCGNILISTGGIGQLYELTTNPSVSTGDGIAMAYRAGAEIKDIEFIQFHPTVFKTMDGKLFLISEALRGEGAYLRDINGVRFMIGKHPLAELAPRDIVVKEMIMVMKETGTDFVYIDATHIDDQMLKIRFPNIIKKLKENNLDLSKELIKVSPAAHYLNGGIKTNLDGQTNINGLYACGETAATGAHGANRLASNSLIEGLVYGWKIFESISKKVAKSKFELEKKENEFSEIVFNLIKREETNFLDEFIPDSKEKISLAQIEKIISEFRHMMTNRVGILREEKRLKEVLKFIEEKIKNKTLYNRKEKEPNEFLNMLYTACLIITSAIMRKESRGGHQRCDYTETDDANWKKHIILKNGNAYLENVI